MDERFRSIWCQIRISRGAQMLLVLLIICARWRLARATVRQMVTRKSVDLGVRHISVADLSAAKAAGQMLDIRVLGLAVIAADVSAELAVETISALNILGALHASDSVKAALADRIS